MSSRQTRSSNMEASVPRLPISAHSRRGFRELLQVSHTEQIRLACRSATERATRCNTKEFGNFFVRTELRRLSKTFHDNHEQHYDPQCSHATNGQTSERAQPASKGPRPRCGRSKWIWKDAFRSLARHERRQAAPPSVGTSISRFSRTGSANGL